MLTCDAGGMDLYVQQFGLNQHDQFYTNPNILTSFMNYTTQVVSRYTTSPAIFSWELANDPRYVHCVKCPGVALTWSHPQM